MRKKKRKIPNAKCRICGKEFYVKPNHLRRGWGKYCSRKCLAKAQLRGKFVYCDQCGKKIWRAPAQLKRPKSGKFFCSKSCQTLWRNKFYSGSNHPFWKGGIRSYRDKYKKILLKAKVLPVCSRCSYNNEIVLAVHHKDGNRKNNNPENLEWLCRNCHYLIHKGKTI